MHIVYVRVYNMYIESILPAVYVLVSIQAASLISLPFLVQNINVRVYDEQTLWIYHLIKTRL